MAEFNVSFEEVNPKTTVQFEETNQNTDVDFKDSQVVHVSEKDHNKLINRELEDQHPIKAISGLEEELDGKMKPSDLSVLTNQELENLLR